MVRGEIGERYCGAVGCFAGHGATDGLLGM